MSTMNQLFKSAPDPTQKTTEFLDRTASQIELLTNRIGQLFQERSICIIHLSQFQKDYTQMRDIYNSLKQNAQGLETTKNIAPQSPVITQQKVFPPKSPVLTQKNESLMPSENNESKQFSIKELSWNLSAANSEKYGIKLKYALNIGNVVTSIHFDNPGENIAFIDNQYLSVVDSFKGSVVFSAELPHPTGCCDIHTRVMSFSKNGSMIATSTAGSSIAIYSMITKQLIKCLDGHTCTVSSLLFLSDNKTLVSGGYDGYICIWDISNFSLVKRIPHGQLNMETKQNKDGAIVSLIESKGEEFIGVGFVNGTVGIYEPQFEQSMNSFSAHSEILLSVSSVPFDGAIATTSHDKTAKIWTLMGAAKCRKTLSGHSDFVLCSSFSPFGPLMLTGSKDETVKGWNYLTGEELFSLKAHTNTVFGIDHHPTKRMFTTCSGDGIVCVWEYSEP